MDIDDYGKLLTISNTDYYIKLHRTLVDLEPRADGWSLIKYYGPSPIPLFESEARVNDIRIETVWTGDSIEFETVKLDRKLSFEGTDLVFGFSVRANTFIVAPDESK